MSHDHDPLVGGPSSEDKAPALPSLREVVSAHAAAHLILSPRSQELTVVTRTYAGGRVRRFEHSSRVVKTEVDLPDGRVVTVHKNVKPVMGLSATRFDSIVVSDPSGEIGTINLTILPGTSPTDPLYRATLDGRTSRLDVHGDRLDLALADDLLGGRPIATEQGYGHIHGLYGSAGFLAKTISAMTPGYTEASFEPGLFRD